VGSVVMVAVPLDTDVGMFDVAVPVETVVAVVTVSALVDPVADVVEMSVAGRTDDAVVAAVMVPAAFDCVVVCS